MRPLTMLAVAGLGMAGCGGGTKSYSAGQYSLTVGDQGYYSYSDSFACHAGGVGELVLNFVDFNYLCDPGTPQQRDENQEHVTFQLVITVGVAPDYNGVYPTMMPYEVGTANCIDGPTSPAIAQFLHYAPKGQSPDRVLQADSGVVNIKEFWPDKSNALKGNFDVKFGAEEIKDSFSIESCN
jgi:hypothetical protein